MKRTFIWIFSLYFSVLPWAFAEKLPPVPEGPLLLTSVRPEQLSAEYWIKRLPHPDRVLKTPEELEKFNKEIRMMISERVDVFEMSPATPGEWVRDQLKTEYRAVKGRGFFNIMHEQIADEVFESEIKPQMQWDKIPGNIRVKWGVAVRPASVRALPTNQKMMEERGDLEFDQLQFTLIKPWTPVGIYHASRDGKWLYVQAPYARGWVQAADLAFFPKRSELKQYAEAQDFLVVTGESIPVYSDPALQTVKQRPTMGTVLPLAGKGNGSYEIWMPERTAGGSARTVKAYVSFESDVSEGYPPYTQRNILTQAFKLLGARYGWGGSFGGRDCSGFTHDVFLSLGVDMPRNSKEQAFVGTQLGNYEIFTNDYGKKAALRGARPGVTLIRMPLHLMLYLGEENGRFYIIHSTWAERVSMDSDKKVRINQVVVSDLSLNGQSYLGSLFDRIVSINEVY